MTPQHRKESLVGALYQAFLASSGRAAMVIDVTVR
jgi:hypothetical protein